MYALIMAGGRGTRFWPRSREKTPKHLLDIIGARTVLQQTWDRIKPIIPPENTLVVTAKSHAQKVREQLPEIPHENIIAEPMGKNTAPCIGLAALHLTGKGPEEVMMVLPADHYISDEGEFQRMLTAAGEAAQRSPSIVTIGINPTGPETGYGYLEQGKKKFTIAGEAIFHVASVREKPDKEKARAFLHQGGFLWNSGIFIGKVSVFREAIGRWLPELHKALLEIEALSLSSYEGAAFRKIYKSLDPISFDYGVMEKAPPPNILLLKGKFNWSDVGSWDALRHLLPKDEKGNAIVGGGMLLASGSQNSFLYSKKKLVALVSVDDLIVVDTKDALLICKRGASQEVRRIVEILEQKKLKKYL